MERLTFGFETEYAVTCNWGGQRRLPPQEVAQRVVSPGRGGGVVLSNGARLYLGSSGCPVYATPECGSLFDLVAHDKAGERILEGLLPDAGRRLSEEGCAGQIRLLKHNNDFEWGTYVCYEHYLTGLRGEFGRLAGLLIPFLVTRQIICGAGKVQRTPRAEHIWEGVAPDGPRSQAIISTRGEPHAGAERFRRLLVTAGDSNMNETATLLKVGATGLVLQMIEAGTVMRDLSLENPIRAIRVISHDITGQRRVRLTNGQEVCALDIQREYLSKARDFTASDGADPISGRVLDLWERALDAIAAQNLDAIARQIDWVTKFRFIDSYRARHGLPLSSPQVAELDVAYHDVHRGRSLYYQLQRDGAVDRAVRDIDIFEAKTSPPAPGRQTGH